MTKKGVVAILGEPTETRTIGIGGLSGGMATWRDSGTGISVQFVSEKVRAKQLCREAAGPQAK